MKQNYSIIYLIGILGIYSAAFSMENKEIENLYKQAENLKLQEKISEATLLYGELYNIIILPKDCTSEDIKMLKDAEKKFMDNALNALNDFEKKEEYEKALKICRFFPLCIDMHATESRLTKLLQKKQN